MQGAVMCRRLLSDSGRLVWYKPIEFARLQGKVYGFGGYGADLIDGDEPIIGRNRELAEQQMRHVAILILYKGRNHATHVAIVCYKLHPALCCRHRATRQLQHPIDHQMLGWQVLTSSTGTQNLLIH